MTAIFKETASASEKAQARDKQLPQSRNMHQKQAPAVRTAAQARTRWHTDKIVRPSAASGGVPEPTAEYLTRANLPPRQLSAPRRILVVLDLNGTLLHRPSKSNPSKFVERPYARTFLRYCLVNFAVAIWSSARPENVRRMCDALVMPPGSEQGRHQMGTATFDGQPRADGDAEVSRRSIDGGEGSMNGEGLQQAAKEEIKEQKDAPTLLEGDLKPVAIWARDRFGLSPSDYKLRVQCYKRLSIVWADSDIAAANPAGVSWSQADTVLVDDSREKARSEPHNLIEIPEFIGKTKREAFILPQVHDYLNELSWQADVSAYMRANPFMVRDDFTLG